VDPVGVVVDIEGHRDWVETRASDGTAVRSAAQPPVSWHAVGGVTMESGQLWFKYAARDLGSGWTTDRFVLSGDTLELSDGRFEHLRADGRLVSGTVRLRHMANPLDLQFAPDEVRETFTVVEEINADS
jgi:hypothetical protein